MRHLQHAVSALLLISIATLARAEILGPPSGTGPLPAVAERIDDLPRHTLYHPVQMPRRRLPLLVWGNGACRDNGLAYGAFLRQIASHGYFIISVGVPREERPYEPVPAQAAPAAATPSPVRRTPDETQAAQLTEAIDWAARETARQGGAFAGLIDVTRVAVGGHSCGGLQALAVSEDARVKTTLVLNSGIYNSAGGGRSGLNVPKAKLGTLHAPLLYLVGGPQDIAYPNAVDDVQRIEHLPVFLGSLPVGHGGTYWSQPDGGDWARVTTRWLDWRLKDDADASWDFAGPACRLCRDARWSVTQKRLGMPQGPYRESRYVAVRDGTRLAMNVYRPAVDGRPDSSPHPVIFAFTPYRARYYNADGNAAGNAAGEVVELDQLVRFGLRDLIARGYVLAMADIRGKGASFGARRGFQDRTEALDGRDLVQWLAAQPWGSDKVGMVGCSYLGGTTTQVASTAPPALKAIFTGATDLDKFAFVRRGGITAQFNTRPDEPLSDDLMSVPLDEDADGALLRAAVAEHAKNTPMAPLWYGMPFRDSVSPLTGNRFWEEVGPYPYLETIRKSGIATYFWGNWQDEPTEQVILWAHNLQSRLLVGPGSHCVPPPGYDLGGEIGRFFDAHLKGADTGLAREPRVTYWVDAPQGGSWVRAEQVPGADITRTRWYLAVGHQLTVKRPPRGDDRLTVDYDVGGGEYFAFWVASQATHGLAYTSAPLTKSTRFVGAPVVELSLAADRSDADVFAYVEDVAPDGTAEVISTGRLKASQRRLAASPYDTLGLPWQSGLEQDAQPLIPGRAATLRFALTPTARDLAAGHSLRVVITGADPRQRNLAEVRQTPPPQLRVDLGGASFVELPLIGPR